jgi:AcrR family transcriptional regulator
VARVKAARQYSSPLRERQAESTRRAVLAAATELFIAQGYGATTIEQVAARAGVSKPTVFAAVGNKQTLLRTVRDVAIAGDDLPVPVGERPIVTRVRSETDQRRAVELVAQHLTDVARRYAVINEVIHTAANSGEEELRQLWEDEEQQRLAGARTWVALLTKKGPSRRSRGKDRAVDIVWLLMSPDNFYRLVHGRGWTKRKYETWLAEAIEQALQPPQPDGVARTAKRRVVADGRSRTRLERR